MWRQRRVLAAALACCLLAGCGQPLPAEEAEPQEPIMGTIAYVPLDDRPDNLERVVYLAESLGYELTMPEKDDYQTKLLGQPLNSNGTQSGDREDLYEWVLAQEAAGCDRYVLSLDQLLSGGLVNSRSLSVHVPLYLSDGTMLTEYQAVEQLLKTLAADEKNRVWLLESVMRLAPTVGYDHWDLEGYNALRSYGMEARPHLAGEELYPENIQADYRLGRDGTPLDPAAFGLTEEEITEYLSARTRKLKLSGWVQWILNGGTADDENDYGNFRLLIGVDDSSEEDSIQKNEIAYLRQGLRKGDALLSGVDDLAFKAVTKLYLEETDWQGASVAIQYFGGMENKPACAYDYQPLTDIVEEHLDFFGLTDGTGNSTTLDVLVLTQPEDEMKKEAYCRELIEQLNENREAHIPTILIDAGNGAYGTTFHEALTQKSELGWLLSYAGFLDMAIVTGTALSHGVARYAFLQNGQSNLQTERAFIKTLADSILKDFCYKNVVRDDLLAYIRNDLSGNPDNFYQPELDLEAVQSRLEMGMEKSTEAVIKNLERSNFVSALPTRQPYAERGWCDIWLDEYSFPWNRAFEISMEIHLGPFSQPHKKFLGIYYR
ncbi:Protein of unknown function [Oscillibacter sp. PC13]|uniref:DUF4127 family protein n=1 Tax=Oscillibacter sp. PC13 TaxID=1855299 RepID=UPI0008EABA21|nr:DUF4127 family protein [Oscillibacter sp. PC13]SFP18325.1 Protein of unknown function [Oscillibacter sp. PC13]